MRRFLLCTLLLTAWVHSSAAADKELPANRWVELCKDPVGARRGSALRYAPDIGAFLLWGFFNADYEFLQESVTMPVPEHDMVAFDPADGRWGNHLPRKWVAAWSKKPPAVFVPRTYAGITSGSERSLFRPPDGHPTEAARPDLNIVFDQATYHPPSKSLIYFTGGLTVAYQVEKRRWTNLAPAHSPPPVLGGSLALDPVHNELVLFGGGNVVEQAANGRIAGHAGTWIYSIQKKDWYRPVLDIQPPPRMNTRMACDCKNQVVVLFGGDGQSHYLADTWLYDLKTRRWRLSKAPGGPPPRAGHFTVYDPKTGWVMIGGGYHRRDLTDMWAYDAARDRWQRLAGEVPAGFYLSADMAPEKRLLILATSTRKPGDRKNCDVLYPVRTTYAYRIASESLVLPDKPEPQQPLPKRPSEESGRHQKPDPARIKAQAERLRNLPVNRWVLLADLGRAAPTRTWGSATFDGDRGRILIWGGGHCGYGGNDVDAYDIDANTWVSSAETPDYPHRLWNRGVRLAGVTFAGGPWTEHGRKIFAYDPVSHRLILVRTIRLPTGYAPKALQGFPGEPRARLGAKVDPPTSYTKYATWGLDAKTGRWDLLGPAPAGLDTVISTSHGVIGVNVDWPSRLNDAGYLLPWKSDLAEDKAVFLFDATQKRWKRLGERQVCPQNLYEQTSLAHDTKRDQLLLHGGGKDRDELWAFDLKTNRWRHLQPKVASPAGDASPVCNREVVYIPGQDVLLTYGPSRKRSGTPALWVYRPAENAWRQVVIDLPPGVESRRAAGQNRALVYDPKRDLVLMVLGQSGDAGKALVFALRYRHNEAKFVERGK